MEPAKTIILAFLHTAVGQISGHHHHFLKLNTMSCLLIQSLWGASHFCSQARNWSWEPGARSQEPGGRRKEPEEVFLQI